MSQLSLMSPKKEKFLKIAAVIITVCVMTSVSLYFNVFRHKIGKYPVVKGISNSESVRFSVLLYGDEKINPGELDVFFVTCEKRDNVFKVLSINTDMVVFRKKTRALSFRRSFNEASKKDLQLAITNLYTDFFELTENGFMVDFYVSATYSAFLEFCGGDEKIKELVLKRKFASRDEKLMNEIEITETFLNLAKKNYASFISKADKKLNLVDSNISKAVYKRMFLFNKKNKPFVMFFDLPAKYTNKRVEPDKQNISGFLHSVYYRGVDVETGTRKTVAEVKNASGEPRMAEKAAWVLRDNGFDVMEWSNSSLRYDGTLIKDYKGYYGESLKAARALGCGKILISYNAQSFHDISIFIGKDCTIYDKLDNVGAT